MKLVINGTEQTIAGSAGGTGDTSPALTLAALLEQLDFRQVHLAVALNETFVPRAERATTTVSEGDQIEIVAPMQGG